MARNCSEVQSEVDALREDIRLDFQSDCWAYDTVSEQNLHAKQRRLEALELELASSAS
jgi:hypothetical protein